MKLRNFFFQDGSRINQVICAVLINLPVFVYGGAIGWMSPMTLLLQSDHSPRDTPLTDTEVSWMACSAYIVSVPANFLVAILGDKMGRKYTLILISVVAAICWTLKLSSLSAWALIGARGLVGVMIAGAYVTCPLYTKEISEDDFRGVLGCMIIVFQTLGNLFLYIIGDSLRYHTVLWICVTLPVLHIIMFTAMPESPSYLVKKGDIEQASKVIAWLRCRTEDDPIVINEIENIKKEQLKDEESSKYIFKAIFTDKLLFRAFKIAIIVVLCREICGAIPVLNFAGEIFTVASDNTPLVLTPNQQAMMLGAVQVVGSVLTFGLVERVGRKILLIVTSLISGLSMCVLASWFLMRDYGVFAPAWLPIVTLCLCIFCDAFGLQPISVVISAELFSFKYRGTVLAAAVGASAFVDIFQMFFFKPVANLIGLYAAFYFFGAVCLFISIYTLVVIPETKTRTVEEIYHDLKTKKEKMYEGTKL